MQDKLINKEESNDSLQQISFPNVSIFPTYERALFKESEGAYLSFQKSRLILFSWMVIQPLPKEKSTNSPHLTPTHSAMVCIYDSTEIPINWYLLPILEFTGVAAPQCSHDLNLGVQRLAHDYNFAASHDPMIVIYDLP